MLLEAMSQGIYDVLAVHLSLTILRWAAPAISIGVPANIIIVD